MSGALRGTVADELIGRVYRELAQLGWLLVHVEEAHWTARPLVPFGQPVTRASWAELLEHAEEFSRRLMLEEVMVP